MTIFRILGKTDTINLQILNVIFATISGFVLYLICKEIFKEEIVQKICLLLIAFFSIYWSFFSVHVYGNLPGLAFGLIALLFTLKFLNNNKIYNIIISAISISLAYLLKTNYEIFACAIVIVLILHFLQNYKKQCIAGVLLVLLCMLGFKNFTYNHVENGTGYSLSEGIPMIAYIYMGIAEPVTLTPGWYTGDVEEIYNKSDFNREKSSEIATELLQNRLNYLAKNPNYTFHYFTNKLQTTWLNPTFQVLWCSIPSTLLDIDSSYNLQIMSKPLINDILCGKYLNLEEKIMDIFQILIFLTAGIYLIVNFKKASLKEILLPLVFLGGFIFHIIWETKAIYVIQYFYIMLPFSSYGLYMLFQFIDKKISKTIK